MEGDVEPVYYMGVVVGYVRKYDSKLVIEMLRAYRPNRFKTPGVNLNVATKGDVFVLTEDARHELMELNQEWMDKHPVEPPRFLDDDEPNHKKIGHWLSKFIKSYGGKPARQLKVEGQNLRGYETAELQPIFDRYCPPQ